MTADDLKKILQEKLEAVEVDVEDQSHLHAGHKGAAGGGGHFRVRIVSSAFEGKDLLERHRMVYAAVSMETNNAIHAMAIQAKAPGEN